MWGIGFHCLRSFFSFLKQSDHQLFEKNQKIFTNSVNLYGYLIETD
jgi:hypothetical protein